MPDTVFPYDDEVVDPYSADDTKNPHEESGEPPDLDGPQEKAAPRKAAPAKRGRPRKQA